MICRMRIGIDMGGTKIEGIVIDARGHEWIFSDACSTSLVPNLHGDSSGVRGAAWLWPLEGGQAV